MYPSPGPGLIKPSILLNGHGNITRMNNTWKPDPGLNVSLPYTIHFNESFVPAIGGGTRKKRYLMRIINTAFDSTFVFSIDNHMLQVVGADFVPIHSYKNESILVGIGQRYHVIVEANDTIRETNGNYWIRTFKANCFGFKQEKASKDYERTGILRYNEKSTADPISARWDNIPTRCSDEEYKNLVPIRKWTVGTAANLKPGEYVGQNFSVTAGAAAGTMFPFAIFSMGGDDTPDEFLPLRVDYANPTFLNLNNTGRWNPQWVVVPENYKNNDWVRSFIALRLSR